MQKQESTDIETIHTLNELRFIQKMNKSLTNVLNDKIHQIEKLNKHLAEQNSKKDDFDQMKKQLNKSHFKNSIISLDLNEFRDKIKKTNGKKIAHFYKSKYFFI